MAKKEGYARLCKDRMVKELATQIKERPNFVITSFMGSKVSDLELLRKNLKKSQSKYVVVKNAILNVVFKDLDVKEGAAAIDGGMGLLLSGEDIISTCRILMAFAKDHDKLKVKAAYIDGKQISSERVKQLAGLPSKDVLLAQVVGGIKSPITGFVNTLSAILRKFVYVVDAIKASKEKAQAPGAAAAEAPAKGA
jgi:large subunit ribosomal protein L10